VLNIRAGSAPKGRGHPALRQSTSALGARDVAECRAILRHGSKSFFAASLLLPRRVRGSVAAFYAFCRVADDAVDRGACPAAALDALHARLDRVYAGSAQDDPVDRALSWVVGRHDLPRPILGALLEGLAWDVEGRRYETLSDLRAYCARVAATVGVAMTVILGERREHVLRRACDLGVAMQLTNIARDVGEDARNGRLYLPLAWMHEAEIDPEAFVARPAFRPELGWLVRRLLAEAEPLYARADHGIRLLPRDARVAIRAARLIYADIGRAIADAGYDTVTRRAFTTGTRKAWLLSRAVPAAWSRAETPSSDQALPEARFLIEAACA
jgi:phytoene synthase